jgi:hypothetical protein
VTHPLMNHDIARLQHQERVALAHAAMHALEVREARSTKQKSESAQSMRSWLGRIRRRGSAAPQTPARSGTN